MMPCINQTNYEKIKVAKFTLDQLMFQDDVIEIYSTHNKEKSVVIEFLIKIIKMIIRILTS